MTDNEALNAIAEATAANGRLLHLIAFAVIWLYGGWFWKFFIYVKNHRDFWVLLASTIAIASGGRANADWSYGDTDCQRCVRMYVYGANSIGGGLYESAALPGPATIRVFDQATEAIVQSNAVGTASYLDCGDNLECEYKAIVHKFLRPAPITAAGAPEYYVVVLVCCDATLGEIPAGPWETPFPAGVDGVSAVWPIPNDNDGMADWVVVGGGGVPPCTFCEGCDSESCDLQDPNADCDCDGTPNKSDCDDDNDGTPDVDEDYDGDGIPNDEDPCDWNPDNDCEWEEQEELWGDDDGDGKPNCCDGDDDGDGVPDWTDCDWSGTGGGCCDQEDGNCPGCDSPNLGPDADPDGDGLPNSDDWDDDNDGIPDWLDNDDDGDGTTDVHQDQDDDGIPDWEDPDWDGDGWPDPPIIPTPAPEAEGDECDDACVHCWDTDDDGVIDEVCATCGWEEGRYGLIFSEECLEPSPEEECDSESEEWPGCCMPGHESWPECCETDPEHPNYGECEEVEEEPECECCDELIAALGEIATKLEEFPGGGGFEDGHFTAVSEPNDVPGDFVPGDDVTEGAVTSMVEEDAAERGSAIYSANGNGEPDFGFLDFLLGNYEECSYTHGFLVPTPDDPDNTVFISSDPAVMASLYPGYGALWTNLNSIRVWLKAAFLVWMWIKTFFAIKRLAYDVMS